MWVGSWVFCHSTVIVEPDFPDHWKTRLLVESLDGDEAAPVYLLRLWAHCQNRRSHMFENLPSAALKALCRYPGHSNKLESALTASGFVRRDGQILQVSGWDSYNASLIANWNNGKKGGRPKKKTHGYPMANPSKTQTKPIRVEKSREEKKDKATLDEIVEFAKSIGLPASDGESCFYKWEGNGWKNGNSPIKDWKATIRSWKSAGYLPSQKSQQQSAQTQWKTD